MRPVLLVALALALAAILAASMFMRQGGFAPYRVPVAGAQAADNPFADDIDLIREGEYLARIGNCSGCHTRRGGEPLAGGRAFTSSWGTIYSSNLTPDVATGLGSWTVDEFHHAMTTGVSRHGPLYPAFPFAHFAGLSDHDLDALYAWLHSLPALQVQPMDNQLSFPASSRLSMIAWRMQHYRPGKISGETDTAAPESRGRYLVDVLGHCAMCHGERDRKAAPLQGRELAGGVMPGSGWYAPPLDSHSLARFSRVELATYLRTGTSRHAAAYGPMAGVIHASLQYLRDDDVLAMADYLQSHPAQSRAPRPAFVPVRAAREDGAQLYRHHCQDCHGENGLGKLANVPSLIDAASLTAADPRNAIRVVLYGAVSPSTAGNRQPQTMPPFSQQLSASQVAAVLNYLRNSFGKQPSSLSGEDIHARSGLPID